jgi:hypothetical protein
MPAAFKALQSDELSPKHVLDIGANAGGWTRYMLEHHFPTAEYFMIDAEPHHIAD